MIIREDSWHYRFLNFMGAEISGDIKWGSHVTLCKYFWNVVGFIFLFLFLCVAGILFAGFSVYGLSAMIGHILSMMGFDIIINLFDDPARHYFLGLLLNTLAGSVLVFAGARAIISALIDESKEPGLIASAYKAHKEKFCPIIELERKEN